ncbi:glutaredoxin domain-containing protein [Thiolapillus sp.]
MSRESMNIKGTPAGMAFWRVTGRFMLVFLSVLLLSDLTFAGGIYSWKDRDGNIHFGDHPPVEVRSKQLAVKVNTVSAPDNVKNSARKYASDLAERQSAIPPRKKKVVMYSASWCGVCKRARKYFTQHHVPFREYDIDTSKSGREAYERYGVTSVPVIAVGKQHMRGFSPESFERFYARASK